MVERDCKENCRVSSLWMVSTAAGGTAIRMSAPGLGASKPAWNPDETLLCFPAGRPIPAMLSGQPDTITSSQVWAHNLAGGDAQPLTNS